MALRLWKKKLPPKEDKQFKQANKITSKVLDDFSINTLISFLNSKKIKSLDYPVSSGKEAVVYRATDVNGQFIAVKIFKFETTALRKMGDYIEGDPRFVHVRRNRRSMVFDWTKKEFSNLQLASKLNVSCPLPLLFKGNIVLMEFEGINGIPYAKLNNVLLHDPEDFFKLLVENVIKTTKAGLVHADLSQYNILVKEDENGKQIPVIIDWGQAVMFEHPKSMDFLVRDVSVICNYFSKLGLEIDEQKILKKIKSKIPQSILKRISSTKIAEN